jgi:hypothetical protein
MPDCTLCATPLPAGAAACPLCGTPQPPLPQGGEGEPEKGPPAAEAERPLPVAEVARPPAGTVCLVVYDAERRPIHYHRLDQDVTRVGRTDAVQGDFADLDLGALFDDETARRVSRKHALVLRSRATRAFVLRPLPHNTGTQIDAARAEELHDYPLRDGTRVVLGGAVRLKFAVMKS